MTFSLEGNVQPFRVGLDVTSAGACYLSSTTPSQIEIGTITMGLLPWARTSSTNPQLLWSTIGTVPSGNAIVTVRHDYLDLRATVLQGGSNGVSCWQ